MFSKRIILAVIFIFLYRAAPAQVSSQKITADKIVATVGDEIILASYIRQLTDELAHSQSQLESGPGCSAIEQAITSKMLVVQALRDSLPVTDEDVEAEMDRIINQSVSATTNETFREQMLQWRKDSKPQVREWMLAKAMHQKIVEGIKVSPAEVKAFFENIPAGKLPLVKSKMEVGQIVFYPKPSKDLESYVINEMNNYKKQMDSRDVSFCTILGSLGDDDCTLHTIIRNSQEWDPDFLSAAFRLRPKEISVPVKCQYGYYLIQMVERKGDNAIVRYLFRPYAVTDADINEAKSRLAKLRESIISGLINFDDAAKSYSEVKKDLEGSGNYFINREQSSKVTVDELNPEVAVIVSKMSVGEISIPMLFLDNQGNKGVRILFLKSRSEQHPVNLHDDYVTVSEMALDEKLAKTTEKWINSKISSLSVRLDSSFVKDCPGLQRFMINN